MGTKPFKVIRIPVGHKTYIFGVKLLILITAAAVGGAILWHFGRAQEAKDLLGVTGLVKFADILGESLEEAVGDNI